MFKLVYKILLMTFVLSSCSSYKVYNTTGDPIKSLRFVGEQIIPYNNVFKNTIVGGLSGIDYANGKYYVISDDKSKPYRFYEMKLDFNQKSFSKITINNVVVIDNSIVGADFEGIRFDKGTNNFYLSSEGFIKKGIDPGVFEVNSNGALIKSHKTAEIFKVNNVSSINGITKNGVFEGISMSVNEKYYWVGMELPLKQDGEKPQLEDGKFPIRISKYDKKNGELVFQFAYLLDKIPLNSVPKNEYIVNGCPEILEIAENQFIFIERGFASGHKNGGNSVKLYLVDCSLATDVSKLKSLKNIKYAPAIKKLLFNFESVRNELTKGIVDNIEGLTFGKVLKNGNKSLILVSDNNFNQFGIQLNQFIVFEVLK